MTILKVLLWGLLKCYHLLGDLRVFAMDCWLLQLSLLLLFFTYHYFNTHLDPTHYWPQPSSSLWPRGTLQNIKKEKKSPYPKLRLRKSELPLVTSCMNNDLRQKSHRLVCVDCYLKTPNFSESFINIKSNLKGCFLGGWTEVFSLQDIHISLFYLIYVMDNIPTGSLQKALTSIPL